MAAPRTLNRPSPGASGPPSLWSAVLLEGIDDRPLLNRLQEESLWADVLLAGTPAGNTATRQDMAALAHSAWERAAAHRVLDRLRPEVDSPDSRHFAAALDLFRTHCARHRLLPSAAPGGSPCNPPRLRRPSPRPTPCI